MDITAARTHRNVTEAEKVRARTAAGKCREMVRMVCGEVACPLADWDPRVLLAALDEAEGHAAELRAFIQSVWGVTSKPKPKAMRKTRKEGRLNDPSHRFK